MDASRSVWLVQCVETKGIWGCRRGAASNGGDVGDYFVVKWRRGRWGVRRGVGTWKSRPPPRVGLIVLATRIDEAVDVCRGTVWSAVSCHVLSCGVRE